MFFQQFKNPRLYIPPAAGLAAGLLFMSGRQTGVRLACDVLFFAALTCLVAGLWRTVCNMGMFNSTKYGFKAFGRLFIGRRPDGGQDFAAYTNSQEKKAGAANYFTLAGLAFLASLVIGISL